MQLNGSQIFVEVLCEQGVDTIFGIGLWECVARNNPTRYSHIMVLTPHFYAHIGAGLKVILPKGSRIMYPNFKKVNG